MRQVSLDRWSNLNEGIRAMLDCTGNSDDLSLFKEGHTFILVSSNRMPYVGIQIISDGGNRDYFFQSDDAYEVFTDIKGLRRATSLSDCIDSSKHLAIAQYFMGV